MGPAPFEIYAKQLALKKNGYALWRPDPRDKPAVQIADIGYIEKGKFIRLFNASKTPGDESNHLGVPEGYYPLQIGEIEEDILSADFPIMSENVTQLGAQLDVTGGVAGGGLGFMCSNEQGAALVLGSDADVQDALCKQQFLQYIRRNYKSWLDFANQRHGRLVTLNDLVLVTGCDKTSAWACAMFSGSSSQISLRLLAGQAGVLQGGIDIWASWDNCQSVEGHSGPRIPVKVFRPAGGAILADGTNTRQGVLRATGHTEMSLDAANLTIEVEQLPRNQCIFVRGFKMLDRATWRQKLRLKKQDYDGFDYFKRKGGPGGPGHDGPNPRDPRGGDSGGQSDHSESNSGRNYGDYHADTPHPSDEDTPEDLDLYMQLNSDKEPTPMDIILDYILENSIAELALAHDDDLASLMNEVKTMDNFEAWLGKTAPKIYVNDQVGMFENSYRVSVSAIKDVRSPDPKREFIAKFPAPAPVTKIGLEDLAGKVEVPKREHISGFPAHAVTSLGVEDLRGAVGVPGLELAVKEVFKLFEALENMKVYRAQCKRLHSRCVELLLALRHNEENLYGTEYQNAIDQVYLTIQRIVRKVELWSKWGVPQSLMCQDEIKLGLDDMDRDLTECAPRLNMVSQMENFRQTHQIERILNQHHMRMETTLQRLLANTKDIHQVLTQPEPKIIEQVLSLQQAIHEHTADAATINSLQERYLSIHRSKTELLPPMNDLTGEVRRISDNPVDISGSFSDVYLGEWLGTEKVALKLTRGIYQTAKAQRRFMKEVGIWRQLQHKNVARLYGVATLGNLIYTVSPWMENRDALRYITLTPRVDRLKILVDVATGLEFLHRHGVVHGDLRAANILISETEVACITDFGLSVIVDEEAFDDLFTLDMSGNSRWMAPELINPELIELHEVKRNPATDAWSYGMLCLEILTGKRPFFNRPHGPAVISDLINGVRPTRPSAEATSQGLSDGVWDLMQKCWQQNPRLRPSMSEIVRNMQAFQAARPSSPRSLTSPIPIPRHSSDVLVRTESPVSVSASSSGSQPRAFIPSPSNAVQSNAGENGGSNGSGPNNFRMSPRVVVQGFSPLSSPRILSANHIRSAFTDGVPPRPRQPGKSHFPSILYDEAGVGPPLLPSIGKGHSETLEDLFWNYTLSEDSLSHSAPTSPKVPTAQTPPLQVVDLAPSEWSGMSWISSEASSTSNISGDPPVQKPVYIKSRENGTVEAANLPGLVERLILDSKDRRIDIQFRKTFLTSYQAFTHAEAVFDLLLERFKAVSSPPYTGEQRSSVRYSVIAVLDLWLRSHHVKPKDVPLLNRMRDFSLSIQQEATAAPTLKSSASRLNELIDEIVKSVAYPEPLLTPPSSVSSVRSASKPPDMTPQAFAAALTVLESNRFKKTIPSDYIGWLEGAGDSNGVSRFITENNKISYWVQNKILGPDEQSQRTANLKYFLCVTEECRKLRNFSSSCALFAGLASPSITNLKRTSKLDKESGLIYQKMEKLISQDKNFQAYRKSLKESQAPCVPSLRVHLHDLQAIHKGYPTFIKPDGHGGHDVINFKLYQRVCEHIHHILQYQDPPKPPIGSHHLEILTFIELQLRSLFVDEARLQQRAAKRAQEELPSFNLHRDALKAAGFTIR